MSDIYVCEGCEALFHDQTEWLLHTDDCVDFRAVIAKEEAFWDDFNRASKS